MHWQGGSDRYKNYSIKNKRILKLLAPLPMNLIFLFNGIAKCLLSHYCNMKPHKGFDVNAIDQFVGATPQIQQFAHILYSYLLWKIHSCTYVLQQILAVFQITNNQIRHAPILEKMHCYCLLLQTIALLLLNAEILNFIINL